MRTSLHLSKRPAPATGSAAVARLRRRTRSLGLVAGASVALLLAGEFARVWRLGSLPVGRGDGRLPAPPPRLSDRMLYSSRQVARILEEGYRVSSTRQNALFNMLLSYVATFGAARYVTYSIRERGRLGPIKDIRLGARHVHHFVPGAAMVVLSGGAAIGSRRNELDRWLGIPFGAGVALVLDESALLLELEDVYWTEQGVVSVQIAFAAAALLAALAYFIQMAARGEGHVLEADWETAARAWDDLQPLRSP